MKERESLLTPVELAKVLGVSTRTIRRLRSQGRLSCIFVTPDCPRYDLTLVLSELHVRIDDTRSSNSATADRRRDDA